MAVESTPVRSLSDLFRSSRAVDATTDAGPRRRDAASPSSPSASSRSGASDRRGRRRRRRASCPLRRRAHAGSRRPAAIGSSFPNGSALERAFRIDQHVGDVLDIADFPFAAAYFEQRIVGGRCRVGGSNAARGRPGAEAGGQRPVLALDVVHDRRTRPCQQRGTTRPTPLPDRVGAKHSTCSGPSWRR